MMCDGMVAGERREDRRRDSRFKENRKTRRITHIIVKLPHKSDFLAPVLVVFSTKSVRKKRNIHPKPEGKTRPFRPRFVGPGPTSSRTLGVVCTLSLPPLRFTASTPSRSIRSTVVPTVASCWYRYIYIPGTTLSRWASLSPFPFPFASCSCPSFSPPTRVARPRVAISGRGGGSIVDEGKVVYSSRRGRFNTMWNAVQPFLDATPTDPTYLQLSRCQGTC